MSQHGDLQINDDLDYQQRSWTVQRFCWGGMVAIAVAVLLGLFGSGVLSDATVGAATDPLFLEYERFGRFQSFVRLQINFQPSVVQNGEIRLWISRDYLKDMEIWRITPEPQRVEAGSDRLTYIFPASALTSSTAVTFHLRPDRIGRLGSSVGLSQGEPLQFQQFIYP